MFATDLAREAGRAGLDVISLSHQRLDVTRGDQVAEALDGIRPDYVVNTAGLGVDYTETHPEEGYRVHSWGAGCLAQHSRRINATLVHLSTCGLFGDEVRFYSEYDPVTLKTKYARSKHLGELEARAQWWRLYVVRCGWLFGGGPEHPRNFVYQRYKEAKEKPVLRSAGDKHGSPTYTVDLARKVLELLGTEQYGVYHISNQGGGSRYDYVRCILEAFGLDTHLEMVDSSAFPRTADTPASEMLDNLNLRFLGLDPLEPWQEAIGRYVGHLKSEVGR